MLQLRIAIILLAQFLFSTQTTCAPQFTSPLQRRPSFFRRQRLVETFKKQRSKTSTRGGSSSSSVLDITIVDDSDDEDLLCDLPERVDESAIQMLVDEIIQDKDTNIFLLPDRIEAGLYRNTVRMTLNAIYRVLRCTDGRPFLLGHQFKLRHYPNTLGKTEAFQAAKSNNVNMEVLEEVADRLLQNKNINQPMIPDVLERQIYINCLKVVFRILDILQGSLRINICGHSIGLFLGDCATTSSSSSSSSPSTAAETINMTLPPESTVRRATSIISAVSQEDLMRYQQEAGVMETTGGRLSFWGKRKRAMANQVHATMFGLVVQIVQDMLDQSTVELVGVGKIVMDLVPAANSTNVMRNREQTIQSSRRVRRLQEQILMEKRKNQKKRVSTFVSGVGVGAWLTVWLLSTPNGTTIRRVDQYVSSLQNGWSEVCSTVQSVAQRLIRIILKGNDVVDDNDDEVDQDRNSKRRILFPISWQRQTPTSQLRDESSNEAKERQQQ